MVKEVKKMNSAELEIEEAIGRINLPPATNSIMIELLLDIRDIQISMHGLPYNQDMITKEIEARKNGKDSSHD